MSVFIDFIFSSMEMSLIKMEHMISTCTIFHGATYAFFQTIYFYNTDTVSYKH